MLVLRTSNFQGATIRLIVPRHKHSIVFIVHLTLNYYHLLLFIYLFICLMKIKTRMSSNTIITRRPQETSRLIIEATSTVVDKQNKSA